MEVHKKVSETASIAADLALRKLVNHRSNNQYSFPFHGMIETSDISVFAFRIMIIFGVIFVLVFALLKKINHGPPVPLYQIDVFVKVNKIIPVGANIILHPKHSLPDDVLPRGTVQKDGKVLFKTYPPLEGVPAGDYRVTIQWFIVSQDGSVSKNLLPVLYSSSTRSPLELAVLPDLNSLKEFHLSIK